MVNPELLDLWSLEVVDVAPTPRLHRRLARCVVQKILRVRHQKLGRLSGHDRMLTPINKEMESVVGVWTVACTSKHTNGHGNSTHPEVSSATLRLRRWIQCCVGGVNPNAVKLGWQVERTMKVHAKPQGHRPH